MKNSINYTICLILVIAIWTLSGCVNQSAPQTTVVKSNDNPKETPIDTIKQIIVPDEKPAYIKVKNWDLQLYGLTKLQNPDYMNKYISLLQGYDIIFIQEIRDSTDTALKQICDRMPEYECMLTSKSGPTNIKEQTGVIYKNNIKIADYKDYNPDITERWAYPPAKIVFNISNYLLTVYTVRIKADSAAKEIAELNAFVPNEAKTMIIGNMFADCNYYSRWNYEEFKQWNWVIGDNNDTTVQDTNCAYDRIIVNNALFKDVTSSGIDREGLTRMMTEYDPVWVEIRVK